MLPLIPTRDVVILPNFEGSLHLGRAFSINAANNANMEEDKKILLSLQRNIDIDEPSTEGIENYGILAEIKKIYKYNDQLYKMVAVGISRVKLLSIKFDVDKNCFYADYEVLETVNDLKEDDKAIIDEFVKRISNLPNPPKMSVDTPIKVNGIEELIDSFVLHLPFEPEVKQYYIQLTSLNDRLVSFYEDVQFEIQRQNVEIGINEKVKENMDEAQKNYYLREKLKVIKDELGDYDDSDDILRFKYLLDKSKMPVELQVKIEKEINKLSKIPPMAAEHNVCLNYLETVFELPYGKPKDKLFDIKKAKEILDEDHYGLKDVKDIILEFLSILHIKQSLKVKNDKKMATVLCLIGPPGIGKTSFAQSIARAMNRKFAKISLGGVNDESEIRGHRRTYVGAMPGRIIDAMRRVKVTNPVILLDEIDKLDHTFKGDPASALLEVLDPSQNSKFEDHYIDYPYDLSNVFFICTANSYQNIPEPLYDRLEIVELESYTELEKLNIAKQYLIQQVKEETQIQLNLSDDVIMYIINNYTREAGVRNLKRELTKLARKIAREKLETKKDDFDINISNIENYLGQAKYKQDKEKAKISKVGCVNGLAWTSVGGTTLEVQGVKMQGTGNLLLTGKLGEVMQESAKVAYSFVRSIKDKLNIADNFEKELDIHLHFPEGAVPKDGPSAGVTITTAIISILTNTKVRQDIAMTGEITITGEVLPVGGIKEKVIAAHRIGIRQVVLPLENEVDTKKLPKEILDVMKFNFVENYEQILDIAFDK